MYNPTPSYDELMARKDKVFVAELDGYLYVKLPAREYYDNTVWRINKETHKVEYMMFTEFITSIDEKAHYIYAVDDWPTN